MHAFDLDAAGGRTARHPARARRARRMTHARRRRARRSIRDMLVIADAERATAVGGVMGGSDSEIGAGDDADRARERVLPARLGPADEQAARPEDRSLDPVRARRRHRRRRRAGIARAAALFAADRRRPRRSAPLIDRYPSPRPRVQRHAARRRASRGCSDRTCPPTTCRASSTPLGFGVARPTRASGWQVDGADASASTSRAKRTSSRKSAATTASIACRRASRALTAPQPAARPADRARPAHPAGR